MKKKRYQNQISEDPLESKDDNEFWFTKDSVNIDSAIITFNAYTFRKGTITT